MHSMARLIAAALFSLCAAAAGAQQQHPAFVTKIQSPPPATIYGLLRSGGYVIFFRHAETDDHPEKGPIDFSHCASQRNLSPAGREHARRVGRIIADLAIPMGGVIASPYCRTMDTARLAFGRVMAADEIRDDRKRALLIKTVSSAPAPGTNFVIVGHATGNGMFGEEFLREAEAMVIRPRGDGKFELVARIESDQWEKMLAFKR